LWSGEQPEVPSLIAAYAELLRVGREVPLALHCVASQDGALETLSQALREEEPDALQLRLEAWSPLAMAQALASCDFVLLPDAGPASRSRLVGALHAGRFSIAWTGDEPAAGIRWALARADEVLARLAAGQRYLDEVHHPAAVARTWIQLFMKSRQ
jgi:hypothetical protein